MQLRTPQTHGLWIGLRQILAHGAITLLALILAFSLPQAAKYILYEWWPKVESDPNALLVTEIVLASVLVLLFNLARIVWDHRGIVATAKLAALVFARNSREGGLSRWRERRLLRSIPAARDAFILSPTGRETFVDSSGLFRDVMSKAYEIRVMLVNPVGAGLRKRADSLPPDVTVLSLQTEIEASIAHLSELRKYGKKVKLKFYEEEPFWKVVVLGDHAWVQHCHSGFDVREQPEYVFALQHHEPRHGLYVPFYMYFLNQWNDPRHPEYEFDTNELVYRDSTGKETGRTPLGVPINGAPVVMMPVRAPANVSPAEAALLRRTPEERAPAPRQALNK